MSSTIAHPVLSEAFTAALTGERESLNAQFVQRRVAGARIDADAFLAHLAGVVDPIVRGVSRAFPERVRVVVRQLYDVSLDLFALSLLGETARTPHVNAVWKRLLPAAAALVARDPARVAASLSNAACNLSVQPDTNLDAWIDELAQLADDCDGVDAFLDCGKVLAWRVGMAQYRAAALATAHKLSPSLAARALRLPPGMDSSAIGAALQRLQADPWLETEKSGAPPVEPKSIRCSRIAGSFRGFGGAFIRPPTVSYCDQSFWVGDGESCWQLQADAYGWHLHRNGSEAIPPNQVRPHVHLDRDGAVAWQNVSARFPELAEASSFASDGVTLAVTIPTSHHVYLLARR